MLLYKSNTALVRFININIRYIMVYNIRYIIYISTVDTIYTSTVALLFTRYSASAILFVLLVKIGKNNRPASCPEKPQPRPREKRCAEPAAGRGYMAAVLAEAFGQVEASDVHDYGVGLPVVAYLFGDLPGPVAWTITNPPFRLASEFIDRALATSTEGVAIFARTTFVEGQGRYRDLFSERPPTAILHFVERVPLFKGRVRDPEVSYWNTKANKGLGATVKPTTATAYSWFVWLSASGGSTVTDWIAPCRKRLTRPGDYDPRGKAPEEPAPRAEHNRSNWKQIGDVAAAVVEGMEIAG